jgi:hypothetical protein
MLSAAVERLFSAERFEGGTAVAWCTTGELAFASLLALCLCGDRLLIVLRTGDPELCWWL